MKKITRRQFLAATAVAGASAAMAACSDTSSTSSATTTSTSTSSASSESAEVEEVRGDPENVIWYVCGTEQADHAMVMEAVNEYLLDKANITLELNVIADGEYDDKMNLFAISGEPYDMCFTSNWRNTLTSNLARDGFMVIDDLVDQYAPDMVETLPTKCFDAGRVSGKLYAVNNYQFAGNTGCFYLRSDLVEKYNWDLSTITEFDDIIPLLEELVVAQDDTIVAPFYTTQLIEGFTTLDIVSSKQGLVLYRDDPDLTAICRFMDDDLFEAYTSRWHEFYVNGYFQEDILTANATELRSNASYGIMFHGWTPTAETSTVASYGADYEIVRVTDAYVGCTFGQTTMTAINSMAEHPEAAMKLMNLIASDATLFDMLCYGLEGVHYELVDGKVSQFEDTTYNMLAKAWVLGNSFLRTSTVDDMDNWKELSYETMDSAAESNILGFSFDTSDLQTELTQVNSVVDEYAGVWYADAYESYESAYRTKLEQAGIQTLVDALQEQLDYYKSTK